MAPKAKGAKLIFSDNEASVSPRAKSPAARPTSQKMQTRLSSGNSVEERSPRTVRKPIGSGSRGVSPVRREERSLTPVRKPLPARPASRIRGFMESSGSSTEPPSPRTPPARQQSARASPPTRSTSSKEVAREKSGRTLGQPLDDRDFCLAESPQVRLGRNRSPTPQRSPRSDASTRTGGTRTGSLRSPRSDTLRALSPGPRGPFARASIHQDPDKNKTPGAYAGRLDVYKVHANPARKLVWAEKHESSARGTIAPDYDELCGSESSQPVLQTGMPIALDPVGRFSAFTDKYIRAVEGCAAKQAMCDYAPDVIHGVDTRPIDNSLLPAAGHLCQVGRAAPYLRQITSRDIMPAATTCSLHVDGYQWFRKPLSEQNAPPDDQALCPRGCETKSISRDKLLESVAGTMFGAGAIVINKGDNVNGRDFNVTPDNDPYSTVHEREFRKRMTNKRVLAPPGGCPHPDAPMQFDVVPVPSPPPRPRLASPRRSASVGAGVPSPRSSPTSPRISTDCDLRGAACLPLQSPVHRPARRQGLVTTAGFSEHTHRTHLRDTDIFRFAGNGNSPFNPQRRVRSSSCPPSIREADTSGGYENGLCAGLPSMPRQNHQPGRRLLPISGQSKMTSYLQYDTREAVDSSRQRRVAEDSSFAQRCRDEMKVNTFAGRVATAVKNSNHNSNSDGVRGCFQWS
jgi:hypothetical protein